MCNTNTNPLSLGWNFPVLWKSMTVRALPPLGGLFFLYLRNLWQQFEVFSIVESLTWMMYKVAIPDNFLVCIVTLDLYYGIFLNRALKEQN